MSSPVRQAHDGADQRPDCDTSSVGFNVRLQCTGDDDDDDVQFTPPDAVSGAVAAV